MRAIEELLLCLVENRLYPDLIAAGAGAPTPTGLMPEARLEDTDLNERFGGAPPRGEPESITTRGM